MEILVEATCDYQAVWIDPLMAKVTWTASISVMAILVWWLATAALVPSGAGSLGSAVAAGVAVATTACALGGTWWFQRRMRWRDTVLPPSDDRSSELLRSTLRETLRVGEFAAGVTLSLAAIAVSVLAAAITRVPDQAAASPIGLKTAAWQLIDGIPLLALPRTWGLPDPEIDGTPVAFRVSLTCVRVAAVVGLYAVVRRAFSARKR